MSSISLEVSTASSAVACAVCPSCHRNSALYVRAYVNVCVRVSTCTCSIDVNACFGEEVREGRESNNANESEKEKKRKGEKKRRIKMGGSEIYQNKSKIVGY